MFVLSMEKQKSKYCNCLCHSANVLARNMTKMMDEELSSLNLTSSYAYLLLEVAGEEGINPKVISQSLELTPSTVTRLIEKLENRGLLARKQIGRNTAVSLTSEGEEFMPKLADCIERFNNRYRSSIGESKIDQLTENIYDAAMKIS